MADLVVVAGVVVFFAICVWFVTACDRIIGPDSDIPGPAEEAAEPVAGVAS